MLAVPGIIQILLQPAQHMGQLVMIQVRGILKVEIHHLILGHEIFLCHGATRPARDINLYR